MRYSDEQRDDDFEVEIVDLPSDALHISNEKLANLPAAASYEASSKEDDFSVEIVDLPPDGTRNLASLFTDLWDRLKTLLPEVHISTDPVEESDDEDDDVGGFDFRVRDLPPEAEPKDTMPVQQKKLFLRSTRARTLIALGVVLLALLVVLPTTVPFVQKIVRNSQKATSTVPVQAKEDGPSYFVMREGGSWSFISDSQVQWIAGATIQGVDTTGPSIGPVPTDCLPGADVTDAHTIGKYPVWVSGFDGPQATIHLRDMPQTMISGRMGWSIVSTIWMHFEQKVKVKFSSANQLENGPVPLFKFDLEDPLTPSISFNSWHTSIPDYNGNLTNNWYMTLFIPGPGCYTLNASWPGGGWHLNFAAGQ